MEDNKTQGDSPKPMDMFEYMREQGSKLPDMVEALQKAGWVTYQHHDNWFPKEVCPTEGVHAGWSTSDAYQTIMDRDRIRKAIILISNEIIIDEGYKEGWKANIAMSIHDEYYSHGKSNLDGETLHKVFNDGAERFLQLLTSKR